MSYHLDLERLHTLYQASGAAIHPGVTAVIQSDATPWQAWNGSPVRILFLCTHNSARSQMAEGIARSLGHGIVEAFSAGNEPATLHPDAVRALAEIQIDMSQQTSKHLDQFRGQAFDYIVTVCDRARESCPIFPDDPEHIHWSFPDPTAIDNPDERYRAFHKIARELATRISYLLTLIERKRADQ